VGHSDAFFAVGQQGLDGSSDRRTPLAVGQRDAFPTSFEELI
jgi:hypothetical protein